MLQNLLRRHMVAAREKKKARLTCNVGLHEGVELGLSMAEGNAAAEDANGGLDAAGEGRGDDQLRLDGVKFGDVLVHGLRLLPAQVRQGRIKILLGHVHVLVGEVQARFVVRCLAMAHQVDNLAPGQGIRISFDQWN